MVLPVVVIVSQHLNGKFKVSFLLYFVIINTSPPRCRLQETAANISNQKFATLMTSKPQPLVLACGRIYKARAVHSPDYIVLRMRLQAGAVMRNDV